MLIRAAARSDVGRTRRENQDAFGAFTDLGLFVVADGVGGHAGGRTASTLAVEAMRRSILGSRDADLTPATDVNGHRSLGGRRLVLAVQEANDEVHDRSRATPSLEGMGTTVAAVLCEPASARLAVCHVGDSRVHRLRGNRLETLTEDHTVVQELLRAGRITTEQMTASPHRHILTRAVGMAAIIQPALRVEPVEEGDLIILTSDGVHGVVAPEEMAASLRRTGRDLEAGCAALVALANERGGPDNSTVILVVCEPAG